MIKPAHNNFATMLIEQLIFFPPFRFLRSSGLAWKCHALVEADRYLESVETGVWR